MMSCSGKNGSVEPVAIDDAKMMEVYARRAKEVMFEFRIKQAQAKR